MPLPERGKAPRRLLACHARALGPRHGLIWTLASRTVERLVDRLSVSQIG
jgi:hypothetical protein